MARKFALIIGNSQYEDACLSKLAAPDVDVRALAEVLKAPAIGGFDDVTPLLNEGLATVRKAIARFFDLRHRDDLLFLYFSGHGVRDEQGHLYLAVRDTERAILAGTAIEASFVTARMDRSASKRLVLVLDCCHSGAFGYGAKAAQGAAVGTATVFEGTGRGRVVLTATDSTQYAWEGDQVLGDVENSLFTHYLIEGLRTGAADRDEDGLVTIGELYDYVYDHVLNETPKQTPGKWAFGQQGDIVIAQNPHASRAKLPPGIEEALASKLPSVRLEAVRELENILRGGHPARLAVALDLLKRLAEDDSRRVATAALESLKTFGASAALPQVETAALDKGRDKDKDKEARDKAQQEEAARRQAEGDALAAQVAAGLATAQAALGRGALDDAREPIARVLRLAPQNADAIRLQETLQKQIEERARLEEGERRIRELRQRIGTLIARANAAQPHDEAIALLNDALSLDPEHSEVKDLLEERHRLRAEAEAAERRARSVAVVKQRIARHLERGDLDDAERALANTEPLAAPAEEFAPLRQRLAELREVRRREAEEAARQRAEAERRAAEAAKAAEAEERKRKEIEAQLAEASRHLTRGNLTNAIVLADVVLELDPEHVAARTLHGEIQRAIEQQKLAEERAAQEERARAEAEGAARQERAAEQARREIEVALQKAAKRLRRDDYAAALGLVDGVLARDGQHAAALELRTEIERASEEAAARPATGFSLPPTLTAATIWVRANALQSNTFRIVCGVVLAVVIGVSVWQPWSRTAPAAGPNQTAPVPTAPTPAPQAPEPKAEPKTEPKTEPPPETKALEPAPENIVARDERVLAAERRARRQIGAGNPEEALKSITQGLAIDANDETLLALLRDIARDAQGRAMRAMRAAEKVGSVAVSSKEFAAGKVAQVDADRLHEAGQHQPAIKAYLDAARYFTKAAEMTPPVPAAPFQPPPVVVNPPAQSTSMSAVAAATEAIDGVRKRYEAAFANQSVEELRALWPSMSRSKQKAYSDHFKEVRSLKLELKCQQPVFEYYRQTARPVAATMWCSETQVLVSKAGAFTQRTGATATFWLRSDGPRWVISDAQHMHIAQK